MSSIEQLPDGSVEEIPPERCPAGHPLLPHGTLVGWSPCDCTSGVHGHRTYTCQFLVDGRRECGLVLNFPPCVDRQRAHRRGCRRSAAWPIPVNPGSVVPAALPPRW